MRKEEESLNCPLVVSCGKKRAQGEILNGAKKTTHTLAYGHTFRNTPDPIWTRKLSLWGPGKYRGGGPRGKTFGCCRLFAWEVMKKTRRRKEKREEKRNACFTHECIFCQMTNMTLITFSPLLTRGVSSRLIFVKTDTNWSKAEQKNSKTETKKINALMENGNHPV